MPAFFGLVFGNVNEFGETLLLLLAPSSVLMGGSKRSSSSRTTSSYTLDDLRDMEWPLEVSVADKDDRAARNSGDIAAIDASDGRTDRRCISGVTALLANSPLSTREFTRLHNEEDMDMLDD